MNDPSLKHPDAMPPSERSHVELLCRDFELQWQNRQNPKIEEYVRRVHPDWQEVATGLFIALEIKLNHADGRAMDAEAIHRRFQSHRDVIDRELHSSLGPTMSSPATTHRDGKEFDVPSRIGRYEVREVLGKGGFGVVCLGFDTELDRQVALKFSRGGSEMSEREVEEFIREAKTVAQLDHPAIVPVYDVLRIGEWLCIVQRLIDGTTLHAELKQRNLSISRTVEIVGIVAEGIGFAHSKGFVHRDLKPSNILLDQQGRPYIADFGLAVHESLQRQQKGELKGTPIFMSPEQVRGETHRMDGRSDIWSLGVMLYQMLTGSYPFGGASRSELYDEIKNREPKPLRQLKPELPPELERICLKCLSKRVADRYATAGDLNDDLQRMLDPDALESVSTADEPEITTSVVPRGLRSFSKSDAEYFLRLLPGPRDRDGLPEIVAFWKNIIDSREEEGAIPVGLIYGPSGCGKSSLVKAGLLPRTGEHVVSIYVEATRDDTEDRLRLALKRQFRGIPENLPLSAVFESLRRGQWLKPAQKLVVVVDQFEQWLNMNHELQNSELVSALRHCDGVRVQCILMVRDDFWLATSRFFRAIEVDLLDGHNTTLVDLFDKLHARKVLAEFGRAYGRLPARESQNSAQEEKFLDQAIDGLAEDDRVICVQLSIFAEMVKGKPWVPETLASVGGALGVGVVFLEETFSGKNAKPERRIHEDAARAVLGALVPDIGTEIRGRMKTYEELKQVSGYARRFDDFKSLMRILDRELRLVTLSDPERMDQSEGGPTSDGGKSSGSLGESHYQLTHDFLVRPLRQWLEKKQKSTMRGRATIRLREHASIWNSHPVNRYLPSPAGFVNTRLMTRPATWSESERKMMGRASRYYGLRFACVVAALLALVWVSVEVSGRLTSKMLVARLMEANTADVPGLYDSIDSHRKWVLPLLQTSIGELESRATPVSVADRRRKLNLYLALRKEPEVEQKLLSWIHQAEPQELSVIAAALRDRNGRLAPDLWARVADRSGNPNERLRAAAVLAQWPESNNEWKSVARDLAQFLISQDTFQMGVWSELFEPLGADMLPVFASLLGEPNEKSRAIRTIGIIKKYLNSYPDKSNCLREISNRVETKLKRGKFLAEGAERLVLVLRNTSRWILDFPYLGRSIISRYSFFSFIGMNQILNRIDKSTLAMGVLTQAWTSSAEGRLERINHEYDDIAKVLADVQVALVSIGQIDSVRPFLENQADLTVRSYLIEEIGELETDFQVVWDWIEVERDPSIRSALLLSLGNYSEHMRSVAGSHESYLRELFESDTDARVHSSAEWILRNVWEVPKLAMDQRTVSREPISANWRINAAGMNMIRVQLPVNFRTSRERVVKSGYNYEISTCEVALGIFQQFQPGFDYADSTFGSSSGPVSQFDSPVVWISPYEAIGFCNWMSKMDGLPESEWCYVLLPKVNNQTTWKFAENWETKKGYRLPTVAEWEYASQAESPYSWVCGRSTSLLKNYAWFRDSSDNKYFCRTCGMLKPNRIGIFDMQGNANEMVHEALGSDSSMAPVERDLVTDRGGVVWDGANGITSSSPGFLRSPTTVGEHTTFRVVRKID